MAANKYLTVDNGEITEKRATQTSAGAANANEIAALDATGRFDPSMLPVGVGPDVSTIISSEIIASGKYVNIFLDSGVRKVRLADSSNGRPAFGFAKVGATNVGDPVTVYYEGPNSALTSLTIGAKYWLGTLGGVTSTPPTTGFLQTLGRAVDTGEINTDIEQNPIYLVP